MNHPYAGNRPYRHGCFVADFTIQSCHFRDRAWFRPVFVVVVVVGVVVLLLLLL
jgi:hypothetical protein